MAIDPKDLSIHDEVLVETEVDGVAIRLPSFVTNALEKELWLALRLPDPRLVSIAEGQRVHLTFDRGAALIVESEFLRRLGHSRLGEEKSRVFAVRRPQGVDQVQRRAHVRVDLQRDIRIKSFGSLATEMGAGRTVNIGAGGVQFTTEMPLMFGDQLRIALVLAPREIVIAGGPVVRIDEILAEVPPGTDVSPAMPRMLTRVAVRFDKITEADQERISCHILAAHRRRAASGHNGASPEVAGSSFPNVSPSAGPTVEPSDRPAAKPAAEPDPALAATLLREKEGTASAAQVSDLPAEEPV